MHVDEPAILAARCSCTDDDLGAARRGACSVGYSPSGEASWAACRRPRGRRVEYPARLESRSQSCLQWQSSQNRSLSPRGLRPRTKGPSVGRRTRPSRRNVRRWARLGDRWARRRARSDSSSDPRRWGRRARSRHLSSRSNRRRGSRRCPAGLCRRPLGIRRTSRRRPRSAARGGAPRASAPLPVNRRAACPRPGPRAGARSYCARGRAGCLESTLLTASTVTITSFVSQIELGAVGDLRRSFRVRRGRGLGASSIAP